MLTEMKIFGAQSNAPVLPLGSNSANTDAIQVKNIEGLGPVKAKVYTAPYGDTDGALYTGAAVGERNIVLTMGLNPNWAVQSIEELRQLLYAYFMPKRAVELQFSSTHITDVRIAGYVESFEPSIFSKDPEIQVSIICPMPNFIAVTAKVLTGAAPGALPTMIDYKGNVETGFTLRVYKDPNKVFPLVNGPLVVTNKTPLTETFAADLLTINEPQAVMLGTKQGQKFFRYINTATGTDSSALRLVGSNPVWLQLKPGNNEFLVSTSGSANLLWELIYNEQFGGL